MESQDCFDHRASRKRQAPAWYRPSRSGRVLTFQCLSHSPTRRRNPLFVIRPELRRLSAETLRVARRSVAFASALRLAASVRRCSPATRRSPRVARGGGGVVPPATDPVRGRCTRADTRNAGSRLLLTADRRRGRLCLHQGEQSDEDESDVAEQRKTEAESGRLSTGGQCISAAARTQYECGQVVMVTGRRSALIVACADYQDSGLQRLRAPAQDAEALASVLKDPQIGGFDVRMLLDEPAHVVSEGVEEFFADRSPEDLLLLHFSCHGVKDESGELYFAASNTKLTRLGATGVAAEFVNRRMNRSRSRRVILLLDCCYAGAFERGMTHRADTSMNLQEHLSGRGRAVITASSSMEYSFESGELADTSGAGPSVFTDALVGGLATGEADRNQDGLITLDELYDHVYAKVRARSPNQTPGKWVFGVQGDLHIARRVRRLSEPTPLPVELEQLIDNPISSVRAAAVNELQKLRRGRHLGLAESAEQALQKLTKDDSRSVATAASAALLEQIRLPVLPSVDSDAVRRSSSESRTGSAASLPPKQASPSSGPHATPRPPRPPHIAAPRKPPDAQPMRNSSVHANPAHASAFPRQTQERVTHSSAGSPEIAPTPRKDALLWLSAGASTILAALLMALKPFAPYARYSDETLVDLGPQLVLPVLGMAGLAGVIGISLCGSLRSKLQGAGMLLGVSAAVPWLIWDQWDPRTMWGPATWSWYVGLWLLLPAAGLAGLAVLRSPEVHLNWRASMPAKSWIFLSLGVVSAVVLGAGQFGVAEYPVGTDSWGIGVWVIMALVVPICVSAASPHRFAVSLATGWAGAAAIAAYYSARSVSQMGLDIWLIIVFVVLLAALVVATVSAGLHSLRPQHVDPDPTAGYAGL
ncbi:caspase family protein [Rhodococcus sp. NPDC047139]|uniref:caspase family protein n=1 Tax=Rhodococcus sp. NPDC047139 TaxID=3155141 RepID=UPI0033F5C169